MKTIATFILTMAGGISCYLVYVLALCIAGVGLAIICGAKILSRFLFGGLMLAALVVEAQTPPTPSVSMMPPSVVWGNVGQASSFVHNAGIRPIPFVVQEQTNSTGQVMCVVASAVRSIRVPSIAGAMCSVPDSFFAPAAKSVPSFRVMTLTFTNFLITSTDLINWTTNCNLFFKNATLK